MSSVPENVEIIERDDLEIFCWRVHQAQKPKSMKSLEDKSVTLSNKQAIKEKYKFENFRVMELS